MKIATETNQELTNPALEEGQKNWRTKRRNQEE
jgi:hypothetical protein